MKIKKSQMAETCHVESPDIFDHYTCVKQVGVWTYFFLPTGWSEKHAGQRTWTVYAMDDGGVVQQIGKPNCAGGSVVKIYTDHRRSVQAYKGNRAS